MPSHLEGPGIWLSVWRFLLTHCLYERAAEVLASLRGWFHAVWCATCACAMHLPEKKKKKEIVSANKASVQKKKKKKKKVRDYHCQWSGLKYVLFLTARLQPVAILNDNNINNQRKYIELELSSPKGSDQETVNILSKTLKKEQKHKHQGRHQE